MSVLGRMLAYLNSHEGSEERRIVYAAWQALSDRRPQQRDLASSIPIDDGPYGDEFAEFFAAGDVVAGARAILAALKA